MGEIINDISHLNNGDGISFFNSRNVYEGVMVNGVERGKIIGNRRFVIPQGSEIHRTLDVQWQKRMNRPTAQRRIWLDVEISPLSLSATDERGKGLREAFDKFGNTIYSLRNFENHIGDNIFIPASQLANARRRLVSALDSTAAAIYRYDSRRKENPGAI